MDRFTIYNDGTEKRTVILYHNEVCVKRGVCCCRNGREGAIHCPAGEGVKGCDTSMVELPDVQRWVRDGVFRVVPERKAATPKKTAVAVKAGGSSKKSQGKGRSKGDRKKKTHQ